MNYPVGTELLCIKWDGDFFIEGNIYIVQPDFKIRAEKGHGSYRISSFSEGYFIIATELHKALS
jgi:hypothetical protein